MSLRVKALPGMVPLADGYFGVFELPGICHCGSGLTAYFATIDEGFLECAVCGACWLVRLWKSLPPGVECSR